MNFLKELGNFLKYSIQIFLISLIVIYCINLFVKDELIWLYAFFGPIYSSVGGIIMALIQNRWPQKSIKYVLTLILVSLISFFGSIFLIMARKPW